MGRTTNVDQRSVDGLTLALRYAVAVAILLAANVCMSADSSQPANSSGLIELARKYKDQVIKRGDFEDQDALAARTAFLIRTFNLEIPAWNESGTRERNWVYDADRRLLFLSLKSVEMMPWATFFDYSKLPYSSERIRYFPMIELRQLKDSTGTTTGRTALGVKSKMTTRYREAVAISFLNIDFEQLDLGSKMQLAVDPGDAERRVKSLIWILRGSTQSRVEPRQESNPEWLGRVASFRDATLDSPHQSAGMSYVIPARLDSLELISRQTGEVLLSRSFP